MLGAMKMATGKVVDGKVVIDGTKRCFRRLPAAAANQPWSGAKFGL
jgi:hypothetical protein